MRYVILIGLLTLSMNSFAAWDPGYAQNKMDQEHEEYVREKQIENIERRERQTEEELRQYRANQQTN